MRARTLRPARQLAHLDRVVRIALLAAGGRDLDDLAPQERVAAAAADFLERFRARRDQDSDALVDVELPALPAAPGGREDLGRDRPADALTRARGALGLEERFETPALEGDVRLLGRERGAFEDEHEQHEHG